MIQLLAVKYSKRIAWPLMVLFSAQFFVPLLVLGKEPFPPAKSLMPLPWEGTDKAPKSFSEYYYSHGGRQGGDGYTNQNQPDADELSESSFIGGPGTPEGQSFKAVGSNNLVNLFTGDFSYSIPLLDVGGYPVNLFYNGGVTMEQEASWVGLGWNINPGTVGRSMRGVPDDFNGQDSLVQKQNTKPNRTWGGEIGVNGELIGIPQPNINLSLGFSYNNYLGPALDLGASVSLTLPIFENVKGAKAAPTEDTVGGGISLGLGAKLSSRSGLTFSPSLGANLDLLDSKMNLGLRLSTSYNSRVGIKDINLSTQTSAYRFEKDKTDYNRPTGHLSGTIGSSTFTFARPSYMPTLRMPMENANYSGQLELGGGMFGIRGAGTANGYYSESKVPAESKVVKKPLVGFIYSENANDNRNAVMDFNRVNDAEVTPRTPIISAPQYTYDIFSIQGEGTGGAIRAYRGDMGFMKDNVTVSKDKNISIGFDIAPPGHYGGNWNIISMPSRVGGWEDGNNTLLQTMAFKPKQAGTYFENVYFRNPGEATVTSEEILNRVGGDNLVRFKLGGTKVNTRLESQLEQFNKNTLSPRAVLAASSSDTLLTREKRTQVTTMLSADDARRVGLDTVLKTYTGLFDGNNRILFDTISRVGGYRKKHHISEISVLEQSGMRYVYGIPVYNYIQKDFTFSVNALPNPASNLVPFTATEPTISSEHMGNKARLDGYVQSQETPAYASSFLLSGLLSPDYVDVTGNGITEDDLGGAVKFNYTKSAGLHKWRTPRNNSTANLSHFNEGTRSEKKDNKATISYGEREAWYLNSIESKAMIAIFKTESRNDAKGVIGEMDGRINSAEDVNKKLARIDLYTKAEIKAKGIANAKPLKSVHFEYDYALCAGTPDNSTGGKLTLKSVFFSYNGQNKLVKDRYVFNYGNAASQVDNPSYAYNSSDRWGTYKKDSLASGRSTNPDIPYTSNNKARNDEYASAWSLRKILLPSGAQMEIQYESDDYGYVQNRRACNMYNVFGLGKTPSYTTSNAMYTLGLSAVDNFYLYVRLPQPLEATTADKQKTEIYHKYLEGIRQLAFKLVIEMPKGPEPLTVYTEYEDYGLCPNSTGKDHIYIKMKALDGKSPLAKSSIGFLTENLPGQAFAGYDVDVDGVAAFLEMVGSMLGSIKNAFKNVENQMRESGKGRTIVLANSFVRLNNADRMKYGGGVRVKRVVVKDNWQAMTGKYTSTYGQDYEYTTTEMVNGKEMKISSGVASYEPGIGSEENPFREIVSFNNKMPLASAQYGAIEMPILEGLYPAPSVGYSKVTVRSIHRKGTHGDSAVRSAIGKQVNEFYTARDYPTYSAYTPLSVMDYNKKPHLSLFYKEIINRRTLSQGFLVETNDMHGKVKSQLAYSASDEKTPLSGSYHTYKNTGKNGLNDKIDFVYNEEGGNVRKGNIGIDVELMTDVREFRTTSDGFNGQIQTDFFTFVPWPIFVIPMLPLKTYMENKYRAVTCTKLINYHAMEDSVIVFDKGSIVSTKNIAFDAQTGASLVSQTANEFNDPVYNVSYPAYWAYSGMGLAYKNIDFEYSGVTFFDGRLTSGHNQSVFESGDELFIKSMAVPVGGCAGAIATQPTYKVWVFDKNKTNTSLTVPVKDLMFLDATGKPFTANNVALRIIRSGRRNSLGSEVSTATVMGNPVQNGKLVINNASNVVNAASVVFKEKWAVDCINYNTIRNPYNAGVLGNFKPFKAYTYYGSRVDSTLANPTAIRRNGYLANFSNYWNFNVQNNLVPDTANRKWVWNSELINVNAKGQEVETRDPLNRYTSAQYGFFKNLPMALAQNARANEMLYEGFEEVGYNESINSAYYCSSPAKLGPFDYIYTYTGANPNPYGVAYSVVNNGNGTQTLTVTFTSIPPGTCASSLGYFNGSSWSSSTSGPTSPRTYTMPVGNWPMRLVFECSNVTVNLDASLGGSPVKPHSGSKMVMLMPNSRDTVPLYVGSPTVYNTDSIKFGFPTAPLYSVNTYGGTTGVGGTATITKTPGGTSNGSLHSTNYLAGFNVSTSCGGGIGCGGVTFYGNTNLTGYYIPTTSASLTMYFEGQYNFWGSCGNSSLSIGGGSVTVYDKNNNIVSSGGTGGCQVTGTRCTIAMTGYSYTVGEIYRIVSNLSFYGSVPSCGPSGGTNLNILHYVATTGSYQAIPCYKTINTDTTIICSTYTKPIDDLSYMGHPGFGVAKTKKMLFSAWVREDCGIPCFKTTYNQSSIELRADNTTFIPVTYTPTGTIIEGWQKIEGEFTVPHDFSYYKLDMIFKNTDPAKPIYFDDIRIHPYNSNMKSYVYDPRNLKLSAELDENNYASFYEYDEEGQLVRVKKETVQGIKTIKESRSAKQKSIASIQ